MRRGLLISILLWPCLILAESSEEIKQLRLKDGMWTGLSVTAGSLSMSSATARSTISLTALPGLGLGLEQWTDDTLGFELNAIIGAPAKISDVLGSDVGFTLYQFEAGILFRKFAGLRATAPAWFVSSNIRVHVEDVQEQRPSVLVSRLIFSPGVKVGYERFFGGSVWWMRGSVGASYPFFVRESPTDSGRPDEMLSIQAHWTSCYYFTETWGLILKADGALQSFEHGGEATRAGGISNVSVNDYFLTGLIGLRFVDF
jgi:hypothetical protein